MYWWIIFGVCIVVGIGSIIIANRLDSYGYIGSSLIVGITGVLALIASLIIGIFCISCIVDTPRQISNYKIQKQYIETHIAKDSIENAALTTKKIELNDWLYNAQYGNKNWHNWNFYPDEVNILKPIQ